MRRINLYEYTVSRRAQEAMALGCCGKPGPASDLDRCRNRAETGRM
jgi:hypothetical protein